MAEEAEKPTEPIAIELSDEFRSLAPDYLMILLEADVENGPTPSELTAEINRLAESMSAVMKIEDINRRPAIAATRAAYKRFGKDPNRYRPSQEQMSRRIVRGLGLYTVNALADLGNLLSLKTGCALGVFDRAKIQGNLLTLGRGRAGEEYTGIGRGPLNVEGLPILRDAVGGIGTPTSDHERTCVDNTTSRIVMTIHLYGESDMPVADIADEASRLLSVYAKAHNITSRIIKTDRQ